MRMYLCIYLYITQNYCMSTKQLNNSSFSIPLTLKFPYSASLFIQKPVPDNTGPLSPSIPCHRTYSYVQNLVTCSILKTQISMSKSESLVQYPLLYMLICVDCHICHSCLYCDISEEIAQRQAKVISWDQGGNTVLVMLKLVHCRTCHNPALEYMEHCSSQQRRDTARIFHFTIKTNMTKWFTNLLISLRRVTEFPCFI